MNQTESPALPAVIQEQGLMPILDVGTFQLQLKKFQEIVKGYLKEGEDYGKIPGTDKDTLLKPGAEKLLEIYGFYADFTVEQQVEDWDRSPELFDYTVKCIVRRRNDNKIVGTGMGSCNTYESKYKWRTASRKCPDCGKDALGSSKKEWGGGFYCNAKKGGCGASWKENSTSRYNPSEEEQAIVKAIKSQDTGRVPNEDIASQKNTVLKMAQKRALVSAAIAATRSSGIFTQDVDDFIDAEIKVTETPIVREAIAEDATPAEPNSKTHIYDFEKGEYVPRDANSPEELLVGTAELSTFMSMWQDKGFSRAKILAVIAEECKEDGVTIGNLNKTFKHRHMARVVSVLNTQSAPNNETEKEIIDVG